MNEPYESWKKKESFTFRAAWLSKKNIRTQFAQELLLSQIALGKAAPDFLRLELESSKYRSEKPGWHHLFMIETFKTFDTRQLLENYVRKFAKTHEFGPGGFEIMYHNQPAPVKLNKPQRLALADKFMEAFTSHPFAEKGKSVLDFIETFKEYALELSVERSYFRRFIDGIFSAEDNPLKSLVGEVCKLECLADSADKQEKPTRLAEGVLELSANTVRVGDWEHTFADDDSVFESVAFEEVNIYSSTLETSFYFTPVKKSEEEE